MQQRNFVSIACSTFGGVNKLSPLLHEMSKDEATKKFRDYINGASEQHGVHPRLIANWDQVWCLLYTPNEQIVFKKEEHHGFKVFRRGYIDLEAKVEVLTFT